MLLDHVGLVWDLSILGRSMLGIFEILKYYGTSWKIKNLNLRDLETFWYILENQYLGIPRKIPTPAPAPDHPLPYFCVHVLTCS